MRLSDIQVIISHPITKKYKAKGVFRYIKYGLMSHISRKPFIYTFIGNTKLALRRGNSSALLQYFTGLYDLDEMGFLMHLLRKEDIFVDVGANVGVYTILSSGVCGATTIAIEPSPSTIESLFENISLNGISDYVKVKAVAVGNENTSVRFTKNLNAINHVISQNDSNPDSIDIPVEKLDDITKNYEPILLKIDIEGYEMKAIEGSHNLLQKNSLKAIIIELNGLSSRYNFDEKKIHHILKETGFSPYSYDPVDRQLKTINNFGEQSNTIYIRDRDIDFIIDRLTTGSPFSVFKETY
jgi:FkbM family methyltransferase